MVAALLTIHEMRALQLSFVVSKYFSHVTRNGMTLESSDQI
jgi:hypothetical protein